MNAIDPKQYAAHQLLTEKQVADWMDCSPKSAHSWLYRHKIKPADAPGRTKRYRAGDVQAALERPNSGSEAG